MTKLSKQEIQFEKQLIKTSKAIHSGDIKKAKILIPIIDNQLTKLPENNFKQHSKMNFSGILIDFGSNLNNEDYVKKGMEYCNLYIEQYGAENSPIHILYNQLNGYSALRNIFYSNNYSKKEEIKKIHEEYLEEKHKYREIINLINENKIKKDDYIISQIYTNYANLLDSFGRPIEAIEYYDKALELNPNLQLALLNKAIALKKISFLSPNFTHNIIFEAKLLLEKAQKNSKNFYYYNILEKTLEEINSIIDLHSEGFIINEINNNESQSKFHEFLKEFCYAHNLYLNATTFIKNKNNYYFGDSLFFSKMWAKTDDVEKFDKYTIFFNQIKQDYIFARYLLVQSQYKSSFAEIIDFDVEYYYPLDYSIYSSYIEMMKISYRIALDTLDKIAFFIKDYCNLKNIKFFEVEFKQIFSQNKNTLKTVLKDDLHNFSNQYLIGLFDMSLDYGNSDKIGFGYYNKYSKNRNSLTHRYFSIHADFFELSNKQNDIDKMCIDEFLNETINVLQFVKAAIFNLALFIDNNEVKNNHGSFATPLNLIKADGVFRWKPENGEIDDHI